MVYVFTMGARCVTGVLGAISEDFACWLMVDCGQVYLRVIRTTEENLGSPSESPRVSSLRSTRIRWEEVLNG